MRKRRLLLTWSLLIAAATIATAVAASGSDSRSAASGPAGRAYVANEATGSVSVIDTETNTVIDTICLGSDPAIAGTPQPNGPCNAETQHHAPLYNGHVDTHGLWLTPDNRVLLVANRISGTIVAVDTATGDVLGYLPVGREPHLATVRPGKAEAWGAIRGENYVEVIKIDRDDLFDSTKLRTDRMESVAKLRSALGPSMVSFTSDGKFAFVAAGKEARVDKFDADTRKIVASRTVVAKFTPFGLVTPDDRELYLVHKVAGQLTILHTSDLSPVLAGLPIGARPNHVFFVGKLAYITIGGPAPSAANTDPEGKVVIVDRTTHAIVNVLTGPAFSGEPHGIWGTGKGTLYIGHERGNRVTVLAVHDPNNAFDDQIAGTVTDSFLKKPIDIVVAP